MRVRLLKVDALQDHLVIADGDDRVAMLLPDMDVPVPKLVRIVELQLVDAELEVGNRRVDPAWSTNYECIRPLIAGHGHLAARCHQRVI